MKTPKLVVFYNIVSKNSDWIGTGWEFFDDQQEAKACYDQQIANGNCPCMRPYYRTDAVHLGAIHQKEMEQGEPKQ
jgi:hypothetical protein